MPEPRKGEPGPPRKGPPAGESGPRKGPPPKGAPGASGGVQRPLGPTGTGSRPVARPGTGPAPRPEAATPRPPADEPATPPAAHDSDDELVFMTHAPGATVAPRPLLEVEAEVKAFEERLKQKDEEKKAEEQAKAEKAARRPGGRARGDTGPAERPRGDAGAAPRGDTGPAARPRDAGPAGAPARQAGRLVEGAARLSEGAGFGAIARTLAAARGAPTTPDAKAPPFWPAVPAALLTPLRRGTLAAFAGGTALLAVCLLLVEVSPRVGLVACAVAALELIALRVRWIRECAGGQDDPSWPSWADVVGSLPLHAAAGFTLAPAVVVALVAYGPRVWEPTHAASVPARAARVWSPPTEGPTAPDGQAAPDAPPDTLGRHALGMLDSLVGRARPGEGVDRRDARELARDLQDASLGRLRALLAVEGLPPASLAWRGLLALGLFGFPIALLAAARLKSAYVPLYPPVLLRAVARAPLRYLVVLGAWLGLVGGGLGLALLVPGALHARLDPVVAHLVWALLLALLVVGGGLAHGALLGRFYRSLANTLGWE